MFQLKSTYGEYHKVYQYDLTRYNFKNYLEEIYNVNSLDNIEDICKEYIDNENKDYNFNDIETSLHKQFYKEIKSNEKFKELYCKLIRDIYDYFFNENKCLIYQSYPSIRFQFANSVTVPEHYDADEKASHPLGEKNFLLPKQL